MAHDETRFIVLRQRLSNLGYQAQTFSMDSADLVDQLLLDLTSTTESYETLKLKDTKLSQDLALAQAQLFPLRKENARLARENYQTRADVIAKSEAESVQALEYKVSLSNAQDKLADLSNLCVAKDTRIRELEKENSRYQRQIEKRIEGDKSNSKVTRSIVVTSPIPSKLPKGSTLHSTAADSTLSSLNDVHPDAQLVASLRRHVEALSTQLGESEEKCEALAGAVKTRDQELARLASSVGDAGVSDNSQSRVAHLELANGQQKRLVAQLNDQVDFLNEQLAQKELEAARLMEQSISLQAAVEGQTFKEEQLTRTRDERDFLSGTLRAAEAKVISLQSDLKDERDKFEAYAREAKKVSAIELDDVRNMYEKRLVQAQTIRQESMSSVAPSTTGIVEPLTSFEHQSKGDLVFLEREVAKWHEAFKQKEQDFLLMEQQMALATKTAEDAETRCSLLLTRVASLEVMIGRYEDDLAAGVAREAVLRRGLDRSPREGGNLPQSMKSEQAIPAPPSLFTLEADDVLHRQLSSLHKEVQVLRVENVALQKQVSEMQSASHTSVTPDLAVDTWTSDVASRTEQVRMNQLLASLRQEIESKTKEMQVFQSNLSALQETLVKKERQIEEFGAYRIAFNTRAVEMKEDNDRLSEELRRYVDAVGRLEGELASVKDANTSPEERAVEADVARCKVVISEMQVNAAQQVEEIDRLESELALTNVRLQDATSHSEKLEKLCREATFASDSSATKVSELSRELAASKGEVKKSGKEEERLEAMMEGLRRQLTTVNAELDSARKSAHENKDSKSAAESTADEMKVLVSAMDGEVRSLRSRNSKLVIALNEKDEEIAQWKRSISSLKALSADRDNENAILSESIHNQEKDYQSLALAKKELELELENAMKMRNQLVLQLAGYKDAVIEVEKKSADIKAECAHMQRVLRDAEVREASLKQECMFLKQAVGHKGVELGSASEDLLLMTRENQALTSELAHMAHEKDVLRAKLGELSQALSSQEQQRVALEVERGDLLETYRSVVQDKRKLEGDVKKIGVSYQERLLKERRLEDDVSVLRGQVDAYRGAEKRWLGDRAALSAQVEELNDTVVRLQRRGDAAEADCRRFNEDLHSMRQANNLLNERVAMVMKRAVSSTDHSKMLSARLAVAENERDALRSTIGSERQRAIELEQVAMAARSQAALAYSRERLYATSSYGGLSGDAYSGVDGMYTDEYTSSIGQPPLPMQSIVHEGMLPVRSIDAIDGTSESGLLSSSSSSKSLPTTVSISNLPSTLTATSAEGNAAVNSALLGALGIDFDNEEDSLEPPHGT